MPVTTLDPKTALLVIDLQKGIVARAAEYGVGGVVQRASALAAAFRQHALPVVLVNVGGGAPGRIEQTRPHIQLPADWAELVPELKQQPQDHLVTKKTWGAFSNTGLAGWLQQQAVTQVVIVGVSTSIGVESTARQAHELGLNVTLAVDAMTDLNPDAHSNSITRIFPRLGETGSTQQIIDLLNSQHAGGSV